MEKDADARDAPDRFEIMQFSASGPVGTGVVVDSQRLHNRFVRLLHLLPRRPFYLEWRSVVRNLDDFLGLGLYVIPSLELIGMSVLPWGW